MSNSPQIRVYKDSSNGVEFLNGQSYSLGNCVQDTSRKVTLLIQNDAADSVLAIESGAIAIGSNGSLDSINSAVLFNGVLVQSSAVSLPVNLAYKKGIFITIDLDTSVLGNKTVILQIVSNDSSTPTFYFTIDFTVVGASATEADIYVISDNNIISNNGIFNIGKISKNSVKTFIFDVANYGIPTLQISTGGVVLGTIIGSEYFAVIPTASSSVCLAFNQTATYGIYLDASTNGEQSFTITITSNSASKSPYVFTVTYEVVEAYNLVVKQSSEETTDGDEINLGSVKKSYSLNKIVSLSNSGLTYIIKVTNVYVSGSGYLTNLPSLPFILEPNQSNKVNFNMVLETSTLGQKNCSLYVQWEVTI